MRGLKYGMLAGLTAVILAAVPVFSAPGDPVAVIKKKDTELQALLRDKVASKQTGRIKVLINGIFDFEELGKHALGPDTWKTMTPDQQKRFVKAFKEMVENASVKKLEVYQSDSSNYEAPDLGDGKASVTAHVFSKGTESVVTYKLLAKDGGWKAWDLIIDDLSTARNYGEQFHKILQTSNIDGLIAKLAKKAAGAVDGKPADSLKAKSETPVAVKAVPAKKTPAKAPAKAPVNADATVAPAVAK
jgi:phospholipid transport system substrate-binding protein